MRYNENAPATRKDVQLLIEHIGQLYVANRHWKEEIVQEVRCIAATIRHDTREHSLPGSEQDENPTQPMSQHFAD